MEILSVLYAYYTLSHLHACCGKEVYARSNHSAGLVMYFARNFATPVRDDLCLVSALLLN